MMPRTVGWGLERSRPEYDVPRLSIAEEVGMHKPGPGDYLRQLSPKTLDPMVAGFDSCVPRKGVEL